MRMNLCQISTIKKNFRCRRVHKFAGHHMNAKLLILNLFCRPLWIVSISKTRSANWTGASFSQMQDYFESKPNILNRFSLRLSWTTCDAVSWVYLSSTFIDQRTRIIIPGEVWKIWILVNLINIHGYENRTHNKYFEDEFVPNFDRKKFQKFLDAKLIWIW